MLTGQASLSIVVPSGESFRIQDLHLGPSSRIQREDARLSPLPDLMQGSPLGGVAPEHSRISCCRSPDNVLLLVHSRVRGRQKRSACWYGYKPWFNVHVLLCVRNGTCRRVAAVGSLTHSWTALETWSLVIDLHFSYCKHDNKEPAYAYQTVRDTY